MQFYLFNIRPKLRHTVCQNGASKEDKILKSVWM